jgi:hypothetical protein
MTVPKGCCCSPSWPGSTPSARVMTARRSRWVTSASSPTVARTDWPASATSTSAKNVEEREVASIAPDPERADYIKLAFELAKTGYHTITTITEVLEEAGLRSRPTRVRVGRPLSRSMVHRLLRDDYCIGIVTRGGVKRRGRH